MPVALSRLPISVRIVAPVPYQAWSKRAEPNVGSPPPRRYSVPCQTPCGIPRAGAEDRGGERGVRAEPQQRGRGRVELLDRGGQAAGVGGLGEQRLAGGEIERRTRRSGSAGRCASALRERALEARAGRGGRLRAGPRRRCRRAGPTPPPGSPRTPASADITGGARQSSGGRRASGGPGRAEASRASGRRDCARTLGRDGQGGQARHRRCGAAGGVLAWLGGDGVGARDRRRRWCSAAAGFTGGVYEIGALRALDLLSVNRTVNEFDVYVGHERRRVRRRRGGQRGHARGDDAGDRPAGADPVPGRAGQLAAAAPTTASSSRKGAAGPVPGGAAGPLAGAGPRSGVGGRHRGRPGRGAAVGAVLGEGHRAIRAHDPVRPGPHRRLPAAAERAVPGRHRSRHVRADRVRRRGLGRRADLDGGQRRRALCR